MEALNKWVVTPSLRVKDVKKSIDFYTKTLGFEVIDMLVREDGKIVHVSVGFDAPLFMLSPAENVRTLLTKENLAKNKRGVGVEFYIGLNGTMKLDSFFSDLKRRGVTVINEPKSEYWGDRIFTVKDPDGYALTFSEHTGDVTLEDRLAAFEKSH